MATKRLDPRIMKDLQPARELWALYRPEHAAWRFRAGSAAAARRWQRRARRALETIIGFQHEVPPAPGVRIIERIDKGDYLREKLVIRTGPRTLMPVYLLIPKRGRRPLPVVLAFHGHSYGVKDIVGLWEDGEERDTPDGYQKDFAVALCRAGFAVAAPEISCFGERQTDFSYLRTIIGEPVPTTCTHSAMLAFHLGGSVVGMRVRDGKRLVDYLETRDDMDTNRLGAMGISGGGMHTFFSTACDTRIKACVVSGYYCTFEHSIFAMEHCACNFVPGLNRFGEIYDLVGLIAPRPMLVEAANYDPIFPLKNVKKSVARARSVYAVFGARDAVETDYFEGRHSISGRRAYAFLRERLEVRG